MNSQRHTAALQWQAAWWQHTVTSTLRFSVLSRARIGVLQPNWRDTLNDHRARPSERTLRDADDLAVREVEMTPEAAWEPHVASGDWRQALSSWATAAHQLVRQKYETHAWVMERFPMTMRTVENPAADVVRCERELDAVEASYRAGRAAGGDPDDWRGWLRTRVTESWSPADESDYGIRPTSQQVLAALDQDFIAIAVPPWTIQEILPLYWQHSV